MVTPEQRQVISKETQAMLQMLVDTDLKIYGEISKETLEIFQTQGFVFQNGAIQKAEFSQTKAVQRKQAAAMSAKRKPSVRRQLCSTAKEVGQYLRSEGKVKSGEAR